MSRLKRWLSIVIVIVGLLCVFYPWISNWLFDNRVDSEVNRYQKAVLSDEDNKQQKQEMAQLLEQAVRYNTELAKSKVVFTDPFVQDESMADLTYEKLLSVDDTGIMCFVEIPKIDVYLPVYHGTSGEVLEKGAGHLEGSSLPVGGADTHAVISAHTGINSSKMFSDLTSMEIGDLFFIHVLNQNLAYKVIDIQVILPEETSGLSIQKGNDLISLLTCTPYGVNTHRLVVMGERTDFTEKVTNTKTKPISGAQSQWMHSYKKAIVIGLSIVAILSICFKFVLATMHKRKDKQETFS